MQVTTDLSKSKIYRVFDMLDVDRSGMIDFDEFYLLLCILLAVRVSWCRWTHYKATPSDTLVSGPPPASDFILGFLSHYFYYACAEWSMWYKIV